MAGNMYLTTTKPSDLGVGHTNVTDDINEEELTHTYIDIKTSLPPVPAHVAKETEIPTSKSVIDSSCRWLCLFAVILLVIGCGIGSITTYFVVERIVCNQEIPDKRVDRPGILNDLRNTTMTIPEAACATEILVTAEPELDDGTTDSLKTTQSPDDITCNQITLFKVCKDTPAGLEDGSLGDEYFSASSEYGTINPRSAQNARLNGNNFWATGNLRRDINHYLQIDFINDTVVKGIRTQGSTPSVNQWVKTLQIEFGDNEETLKFFRVQGSVVTFTANTDPTSIVDITFPETITTRILRIVPTDWNYWIAMRLEVILQVCDNITAKGCPPLWTHFQDNCYRFFGHCTTWLDAEEHCKNYFTDTHQAHLVSIHSKAESDFVSDLWRSSLISSSQINSSTLLVNDDYGPFDSIFLGLNDMKTEGVYVWSDDTPYNYSEYNEWAPGEPNNDRGREDCTQWLHPTAGVSWFPWNDWYCNTQDILLPYVCKLKP